MLKVEGIKLRTSVLALLLAVVMAGTACTASWIQTALQDLPVLIQIAANIAGLVSTVQGQPVSPAEQQLIANIGAQAGQDLQLIQTLYNQYKANPNQTTLQKIQDAIATADQNLPAMLAALHVSNNQLVTRVTAAVQLILTTIDTFSALIPTPPIVGARKTVKVSAKPPTAKQLKVAWRAISGKELQ